MTNVELTYLGTHWGASGDLFRLTNPDGREARVFVDSLGETWVDVRVVPAGGSFHTERVEAYFVASAATAEKSLREQGFTTKRVAPGAHRVMERPTTPVDPFDRAEAMGGF